MTDYWQGGWKWECGFYGRLTMEIVKCVLGCEGG